MMATPIDPTSTTVEDESEHYQLASLDRPCQYCKALQLDDAGQGGIIKQKKNGERLVDFGEVQETYSERKATNFASTAYAAGLGKLEDDTPETWPRLELKLGYERDDIFPDLPGLALTASQGCAFCRMLRRDLISAWDKEKSDANKNPNHDDNEEEICEAKLIFTGMSYKLYEASHDNEDETGIYFDALYVFFVIDWGSRKDDCSFHYNIHADATDPCASWFQIWRRPLPYNHLSPPSIERLKALIAKSLPETPLPTLDHSPYYPTRLLDVGSTTHTTLRLVESAKHPVLVSDSANTKETRYAALSYCWGSKDEAERQLRTTHNTIKDHLTQIDFGHLPQTVADAVQVCRSIGIRYLWVDALCIIQDDEDDWAKESFEMANVYANSFVTLCILQGSSCARGFLKKPYAPKMLSIDFRSGLDNSVSGRLYLRMLQSPETNLMSPRSTFEKRNVRTGPDEPAKLDFREAAWSTRGWTFQEAWLSPRKILFGSHMFHISRGNLHESADGSEFDDSDFFPQGDVKLGDMLNGWYNHVTEYGKRTLSYERDRFPALSAMPRIICEKFPDQQYLAGLWKSDLHRGLLWTPYSWSDLPTYLGQSEEGYISPSWSWAHCPYGLNWLRGVTTGYYAFSPEFELRQADVVTEPLNPYGRVLSATLHLDAKIFQLPFHSGQAKVIETPDSERRWLGITFHYTLRSDKDEYIASLHLDWITLGQKKHPEDPLEVERLWMVLISRSSIDNIFNHWSPSEDKHVTNPEIMVGLLLLPTGKENEFVKVGLWYSETRGLGGSKFWDDIQKQPIRLV